MISKNNYIILLIINNTKYLKVYKIKVNFYNLIIIIIQKDYSKYLKAMEFNYIQ